MNVVNLFPGSWGSNCYIISDSGRAAVIDPSASAKGILDYLKKNNLTLDFIILTHAHFDHILSLDTLRDATGVFAYIHKDDADSLSDGRKNAFYTFFGQDKRYRSAERTLDNGDILTLGESKLKIISTPGHTKGSICILTDDGKLFTGDTLFADAYGRCDLYSGNSRELWASLKSLRSLNGKLTIYPGHGMESKLSHALDVVEYL